MTFPAELERLLKEATAGKCEVYDSCSWRRIGLAGTYKEILWPTNSPSDGHPDLSGVNRDNDLSLLIYLRNHADAILGLVRAAEMAQESLARHEDACKGWIDDHHVNTKLALHEALAKLNGGKG